MAAFITASLEADTNRDLLWRFRLLVNSVSTIPIRWYKEEFSISKKVIQSWANYWSSGRHSKGRNSKYEKVFQFSNHQRVQ